tara:strand:+ start:471 stop:941 length:471 start_codon:yes stop_codon:yes gene_type:complete
MDTDLDIKVIRTFEVLYEPIKTHVPINKKQNIENKKQNIENNKENEKIMKEKPINEKKNINLEISKKKISENINYSHLYDIRLNHLFKKIKEIKKTNSDIEYQNNLQKWYQDNRNQINSLFSPIIKSYYNLGIKFNNSEQNIYDYFIEFIYEKTLY